MRITTHARDGVNALARARMNASARKQAGCLPFLTHRENLLHVRRLVESASAAQSRHGTLFASFPINLAGRNSHS
jgi:hypothetical protein